MQQTKYFHTFTLAFTLCLIMSNLAEIKVIDFFGYALGAGTIVFPFVYILNDIITEVYGFSEGRKVIWTALFCNIILTFFMYFVCFLPPSEHWPDQEVFVKIFSISPRIVIASITAYLLGELINSSILSTLKIKFSGKYFAPRAIVSTFFGALIESIAFGYIAFYKRIPDAELIQMIILLSVIKVLFEIIFMPITIMLVRFLKMAENIDVFEKPSLRAFIFGKTNITNP